MAIRKADFDVIVRENQAMVYSIAWNFFHDSSQAEEVAQDVFLQLYENRQSIESNAHITSWLRRAASHRCIDRLRRRRTRNEVQLDDLPEISGEWQHADPLLQERLQRLVASLPEKPRMVMVLHYGEDMDPAEIGEILRMPVRTVRSHLQRGVAMLREKAARRRREEINEPV